MGLGASNDSHLIGTDDGEVVREPPPMRGLCVHTNTERVNAFQTDRFSELHPSAACLVLLTG